MLDRNGRLPVKEDEIVRSLGKPRGCRKTGQFCELSELLDEFTVECDPDIAQEVAKISADAITWAGKHFNIQCPHKGDPAIGNNWYSVH